MPLDRLDLHIRWSGLRERAAEEGSLDGLLTDALAVLESTLFDESQAWGRRDLGNHLVGHVEALWSVAAGAADTAIIVRAMKMCSWAVRQLLAAADLTRAIKLGRCAPTDSEQVLGPDHPDTLASLQDLVGLLKVSILAFEFPDPL
ncbi:hypothetical protein OG921_04270 [Aldersonia sp. NBC_00410]|uniref:hypothetical protein n=1 Tax=Aldersonia sp. NBC_00410 TaxID=2975954 RepID=UPI002250953A|nr:hypothetical protein [Aldersonia sp. NBC_00410]MCX5042397.1 hypothetical protein [Aldersonia sp. NBC_00410]